MFHRNAIILPAYQYFIPIWPIKVIIILSSLINFITHNALNLYA